MLYIEIAVVIVLMIMNGVLSMSELAIVSAKKIHLKKLANEGSRAAAKALELSENTGLFLPTVQIGITLIGILAGAFSGATIADHLTDYLMRLGFVHDTAEVISVSLIVMAVTYLTLIIGELVPKELALRRPEKLALFVAPIIGVLAQLTWPLVWILNRSSSFILRIIRAGEKPESTVTQEEVEAMIVEGARHGVFEKRERDMLAGVMLLADKPVRAFMVPRVDVVCFDCDAGREEVSAAITEHGFSLFPVRAHGDERRILGIVETKDILAALLSDKPFDLKALIREVGFFPGYTSAIKIIEHLRRTPAHVAIVIDEHGSFQGIVTLIDLFGTITGEFYSANKDAEITKRRDGSWLIDGGTLIDRAFKKIGLREKISASNYHTLAGFVLHHSHKVPSVGDVFDYKNYSFEVVDMDGYRVDKVLVIKKAVEKKRKKSQP